MAGSRQEGDVIARCDIIVIDDDDDDVVDNGMRSRRIEEEAETGRRLAQWAASLEDHISDRSERRSSSRFSDLDERIEDVLEGQIADIVDLTSDDDDAPLLGGYSSPKEHARDVDSYNLPNGIAIRPGMTVELCDPLGTHSVQFLRVVSILDPGNGSDVVFRGFGFARTRQFDGMLLARLNEVAMVAQFRSSDTRRRKEHALMDVKARDVSCTRELRITNAPFPEHRFDADMYSTMGKTWVETHSPLVCRFRYEIYYHGTNEKPFEWALVRIDETEADPEYRLLDEQNLNRWRGGKVPGGSHNPAGFGHSAPVVDLDIPLLSGARPSGLSPGQRYTAGDVFAGAGGASRGIERAGVQLRFAVDHWQPAAMSLRRNFPQSRIYEMNVTDFVLSDETPGHVDILHISPPCQFWSPAHTTPGKNDEQNIAVLFSSTHLIKKFRPRLFTVEQTFGILSPKFAEFFNTFLYGFTTLDYSVRWKVIPLANYGVPQLRKRLIIIGSAPGEALPPFPPPTHSRNGAGGLKPWATPQSVLANVTSSPALINHKLHRLHRSRRYNPPKPRWDPTKLARTITCNGGQNYHWSGERDFTLLEYAVLQGFPTWHKFEGSYVKKQIGNAFAPSVVKVLYDHLVDWLLVRDGFDPAHVRHGGGGARAALPGGLGVEDYVCLDDDGGDDDGDDGGASDGSDDGIVFLDSRPLRRPSNGSDDSSSDESVVYLGAQPARRLSEVVRELNMRAKEEDDCDMYDVDDISDSETLRDGEISRPCQPDIIDVEMGGCEGHGG